MLNATFTVDSHYPAITYAPLQAWVDGDPAQDNLAASYSQNGTFRLTEERDATATFKFNGTAVSVYGGKRGNHGSYTVRLDNQTLTRSGFSEQAVIPALLFSQSSLPQGPHTLVMTNVPDGDAVYLDIDYITYEANIGSTSEKAQVLTIQDTAGEFSYEPLANWNTDASTLGSFNEGSAHYTKSPFANVTCNFQGDAISIYGAIGPNCGSYVVTIDGHQEQTFDANYFKMQTNVPLFEANNLGPGNHSIVLTSRPYSAGQFLVIDYAKIQMLPGRGDGQSSQSLPLSPGAIAAIGVGTVLIFFAMFVIWFFVALRRKRKAEKVSLSHNSNSSMSVVTPFIVDRDRHYRPSPLSQSHTSRGTRVNMGPHRPQRLFYSSTFSTRSYA